MMLVQLVYTSAYAQPISLDEARAIARGARKTNAQHGITGMLMFGHGHFLQVIEGGSEAVNDLYHRIAQDPRHEKLRILSYRAIDERAFGCWSMAHVDATTIGADILLRFGRTTDYEPASLTGEQALGLLTAAAQAHEKRLDEAA